MYAQNWVSESNYTLYDVCLGQYLTGYKLNAALNQKACAGFIVFELCIKKGRTGERKDKT